MPHCRRLNRIAIGVIAAIIAAFPNRATADTPPVVFLHGFCSSADVWRPMVDFLQPSTRYGNSLTRLYADLGKVRDRVDGRLASQAFPDTDSTRRVFSIDFYNDAARSFDVKDVANVDIPHKALELRSAIHEIKRITGQSRVVLVGHSMGGLVARAYVQGLASQEGLGNTEQPYRGDVAGIVTIDTPHKGSDWADSKIPFVACKGTVNRAELSPTSALIGRLNSPSKMAIGVPIWSLRSWPEGIKKEHGDGIVSYDQQSIKTVVGYNQIDYVNDVDNFVTSAYVVLHTEVHSLDETILLTKVSLALFDTRPRVESPAPWSAFSSRNVETRWADGVGGKAIEEYWLYAGTAPGAADLFNESRGTKTTATISNLPANGSQVFLRLWWRRTGTSWTYNDFVYRAATASATTKAELVTPNPGSTLSGASVQLTHSGGSGVSQSWLYLGSTAGARDLLDKDLGTSVTANVSGLPTNGTTVHVRLWSFLGGLWLFNDYTLKAASIATATPAQLIAPAPGSTLTASNAEFLYSTGSGVSQYRIEVGSSSGKADLYSQDRGTSLTANVTGLPTNGAILHVRLSSLINGTWRSNDYTYKAATIAAATARAQLLTPAPGSTLSASSIPLQYSGGVGVTQYWVYVGTSVGARDLLDADRGSSLTATVSGLPTNGSTIYVRLWSLINNAWQYNDYTYQARTAVAAARAQLLTPAPGSTLSSSSVQVHYSGGTSVNQYWLYVGTSPGAADLFNQDRGTSLTATVSGLPNNGGTLYVRLWSLIDGVWQWNDYTYRAPTVTATRAQLLSPSPGSTLSDSTVLLQHSGGSGVSKYWIYVGTEQGRSDLLDKDRGTNLTTTVTSLPTDGRTIYVRLWSLMSGVWQYNDYTYKAKTVIANSPAQLLTPPPGTTLADSAVKFEYSGGIGVNQYWLFVGTAIGTSDLFNQDRGTSLSATASGLPKNGSTIYVRLWSLIGGGWQYNDYTFKAAKAVTAPAQLLSPAPGSTLTASTMQMQYSGGTGVSEYWIQAGTSLGNTDLYNQSRGTSLTATIAGLPTDGRTIFVRLWSLINQSWQFSDYTYRATTIVSKMPAQLQSPAPGVTLSASTVQLRYTGGVGVSEYWVYVGRTPGGLEYYSQSRGTNLTATVSGLPANGTLIYVRIWSMIDGYWHYNDYTYRAAR